MKTPKVKFPTSQEIYNQILWDARFDESQFAMVYKDRKGVLKSKGVPGWDPYGDVPWHRVVAIEHQGKRVWDREARQNDLDAVLEASVMERVTEHEGEFEAAMTYRFDSSSGEWVMWQGEEVESTPHALKVVTWNVLFDLYDTEVVRSEARWPSIFAHLESSDADLLVLVEMTPSLMQALLAQAWVRQSYWVSDAGKGQTVEPYGQLILSRHPMSCRLMALSKHKRAVLAKVQWREASVSLCAVHLPSSRDEDASQRRQKHLQRVLSNTQQERNLILAGDFNLGDGEPTQSLANAGMMDTWQTLCPGERGVTYEPSENELAAHLSKSQIDARYDRVYWRHEDALLHPRTMDRFATKAIGPGLFASDHYGLALTFDLVQERPGLSEVTAVVQSACALLLPSEVEEGVQRIRQEHDRSFERWMPHINMLYPFVPKVAFAQAVSVLAPVAQKVDPFEISLEGFETFTHHKSSTVWLAPTPSKQVVSLQREMEAKFPLCSVAHVRGKGERFTPHLTVAQFKKSDHAQMRGCIQEWQKSFEAVSFVVSEVALIARKGDEPFVVHHRIPLGDQGGIEGVLWAMEQGNETTPHALRWMDRLERVVEGLGCTFEDVGSTRVGTSLVGSDIDFVVTGPQPANEGLATLAELLRQEAGVEHVHLVLDAAAPAVRCQLEGRGADFLWLQHGEKGDALPGQLASGSLAMAKLLVDEMVALGAQDVLVQAIKVMKYWAKTQQIYGTAWGYWGGVSWSLVVIWAAKQLHQRDPAKLGSVHEVLCDLFERLACWSWPYPVSLEGHGELLWSASAHMPVMNPVREGHNTSRSMTKSSARTMKAAMVRAWRQVQCIRRGESSWGEVMAAAPVFCEGVSVRLEAEHVGLVEHSVVGMMVELEALGHVRPMPQDVAPGVWELWVSAWDESVLELDLVDLHLESLEALPGVSVKRSHHRR